MDNNHIRSQKSWLCDGPNSMKGHLEVMKKNCPAEPTTMQELKEEQLIKDLEATISNLEEFYNEIENR